MRIMQALSPERLEPETIHLHGGDGAYELSAQILPKLGANLISFNFNGTELIHWDEKAFLADMKFTGAFNMFPTPCRLANCSYEFEGKKIVQRKKGKDVFIHGLIRDEIMESRNDGDRITSWLNINPDHAVFEGFPFKCMFSVTHSLHKPDSKDSPAEPGYGSGLTVSFRIQNNDSSNIPCGYGIHPFWRIQGQRKDVLVSIPCDHVLELKDLIPTGNYMPVTGTDLDLRKLRSIENLYIDNTFWKRKPGKKAEIVFKAIGRKIVIEASDNFPIKIVYSPENKEYICVETLTTSPNAPNLVSTGKENIANMLVIPPGDSAEGWIRYTVEPVGNG